MDYIEFYEAADKCIREFREENKESIQRIERMLNIMFLNDFIIRLCDNILGNESEHSKKESNA